MSPEGQEPSQEESLSLKLNILDELINNEILLERAKKLNLVASDGEVEDKFTEMKSGMLSTRPICSYCRLTRRISAWRW